MILRSITFILFLFICNVQAAQDTAVPDELKNWVPWVLDGKETLNCPFLYSTYDRHHCAWPDVLSLVLNDVGGFFIQKWTVYEDSLIALPGGIKHWPQNVIVNKKPVIVLEKDGVPYVQLLKGVHELEGVLIWNELPEFVYLPRSTGLIDVNVNNKHIKFPRFGEDFSREGQLWLSDTTSLSETNIEDHLQLDVSRRVIDSVPLKIMIRLELNVVGKAREISLGPIFSENFVPLSISGQLPMRLEIDGKLKLQVRPGQWVVQIEGRHKNFVDSLALIQSNLPDTEVWVFDAQPSLRLVEIEGVAAIDPRQTRLPKNWHKFPAYQVTKTDRMNFITKRRGDPEPVANELTLSRNLWLDFDGGGYTFSDQINGQMRRGWRLNMIAEMTLGRVSVNQIDQLVTQSSNSREQGIEIRKGEISVQADGRYLGDISQVPAVGWLDNFTQVQTTLHLPPGWCLFTVSGADSVGGASWVERWTLLDLFLVLIAALAIFRLFGWAWGIIALFCFVISWHESNAPQYIWLMLIVVTALLRVAPAGKLKKSIAVLRYLSLVVLVLIAIPFLIDRVRTAIHPQLENPEVFAHAPSFSTLQSSKLAPPVPQQVMSELADSSEADSMAAFKNKISLTSLPKMRALGSFRQDSNDSSQSSDIIDPRARVQTGPGLPEWSWSTIPIQWNGPVQQGQMLGLTFLSPGLTSMLKWISAILLVLLGLRIAIFNTSISDFRSGLKSNQKKSDAIKASSSSTAIIISSFFIFHLFIFYPDTASAEIPTPEMLEELEKRLVSPPACLPQCAQISRMKLEVNSESIRILMEVHASEDIAIPLPGEISGWQPSQVIVDGEQNKSGQQSQVMRSVGKSLWVQIPEGKHQIQIAGPIRQVRVLQLPLPLQPKKIDLNVNGWVIKGIHNDGSIDKTLQLARAITEGEKNKVLEQTALPPFVLVKRTLRLGLKWQVETQIIRQTPLGTAITLQIPLLKGESVTTDGIHVNQRIADIQFEPQQRTVRWRSVLKITNEIVLTATDTQDWVEQWQLDVSPMWHVQLRGIPQIHHQSHQGVWFPQWQPWPGEKLTINVTQPTGIEGTTKTIDQTQLMVKSGERATDVSLNIRLRSSQADQHTIRLPEDSTLGLVEINGTSQPIRQEAGGIVRLPLNPGVQNIKLNWQTNTGINYWLETPPVNLGIASVNANISVKLPANRWTLLTFGPQLGPAVLFWGLLLVVIIIAIGLGRTRHTPLKTHQWLLLCIGLSQAMIGVAVVVVGWLFAMSWRGRHGVTLKSEKRFKSFNLIQIGLAGLTFLAIAGLVSAVGAGLLGHPDMQISGNGSSALNLKWYADHSNEIVPTATVLTAPLWLYRVLMLVWSLWLAFALLAWLKWAWVCFNADGLWQALPVKAGNKKHNKIKKEDKEKNYKHIL